jgi:hypothetical protein
MTPQSFPLPPDPAQSGAGVYLLLITLAVLLSYGVGALIGAWLYFRGSTKQSPLPKLTGIRLVRRGTNGEAKADEHKPPRVGI